MADHAILVALGIAFAPCLVVLVIEVIRLIRRR